MPRILSSMDQPFGSAQRATLRSLSDSALDALAVKAVRQAPQPRPQPEAASGPQGTEADAQSAAVAPAGVSRCGTGVASNVMPFRRTPRPLRSSSPSRNGLWDSHTPSAANSRPRLATSVLRPQKQQRSAAALAGTAQYGPEWPQAASGSGAAHSSPWPALALHSARGSLRLAQMIKDAPWHAVKAARSAFIPFGQQVYLPAADLGSLTAALSTEPEASHVPGSQAASIASSGETAAADPPALRGSLLCPASHRVPSYRSATHIRPCIPNIEPYVQL